MTARRTATPAFVDTITALAAAADGKRTVLPVDMVHPVIVTGLEAIGRGHDQRNLQAFVKEIIGTLGPEIAIRYLKPLELI